MPSLVYGTAVYDKTTGNLPPLTLINMFVEKAATSEQSMCLQSRPGLTALVTNGSGPINKIFCNAGTLSGDDFSVSGTTLYRGSVSKGAMASLGSGPVSMAGSNSEVLIAGGGTMYRYNGTGSAGAVTFPDTASVRALCFIGSLFVAIRGDGAFPGRFYWSSVLDGSTWDALSYATAEREADELLDIAALNDKLILYGQSTIEVWSHTGAADLPFTRVEGIGSQSKGIKATGAKCEADNTFFHVGSDGVVYRFGDQFDRVSEHWLEEKIAASTACAMFAFRYQGHEFVCVRLDSQTFALDCATQAWCELQTSGGQWIAQCAAMKGTVCYLGHSSTGQIMGLTGVTDLGADLTRTFSAAAPLDQPGSVNNLWLWVETGSAITINLQSSMDAGESWDDRGDVTMTTSRRAIPEWRRLGQFDAPGAMFKASTTSAAHLRISAVKFNEPLGGRSRN